MEVLLEVLLVIGGIALVILFWVGAMAIDKGRIRDYVEGRGGRIVSISRAPFGRGWFGEKGAALGEIVREVNDDGVKISYDAGNVMDYHKIDPLPDIRKCVAEVRSFCIKDHRLFPKDQDCGPGFGEIDHYKLLAPVACTGRVMPLCCENVFAPLLPLPTEPEAIDTLARRAREFLEVVVAGLQAP